MVLQAKGYVAAQKVKPKEARKGDQHTHRWGREKETKTRENDSSTGGLATLSSRATVRARALVYMKSRSARLIGLRGVHALLDVRRKIVEGLLDVDVVLGRNLQERDAQLIRQLLSLFGRHSPLLLPVTLVADENLVYPFAGVLFDVREPGADVYWRASQFEFSIARSARKKGEVVLLWKDFSSVTS